MTIIGSVRVVRRTTGKNKPGHVLAPGKCKFANPWKFPDSHGQILPVPVGLSAGPAPPDPAE
eukprot:8368244-Pyramimonas_sp.AAC.1